MAPQTSNNARGNQSIFDISEPTTASTHPLWRVLYGSYAWLALLMCVMPVIAGLALAPGVRRRRWLARWGAKAFFSLIGSPVRAAGGGIPHERCVVVANHSSYLDGIILTAALPAQFTFVIKQEMARIPVAGFVLRRLGSEFVDRADGQHRSRVARRLLSAAQAGDALAFFPEGTFDDAPGLKQFQSGAFGAAWRGRLPVVPVVISGARAMLRSGRWLPAPSALALRICEPLHPGDFTSARELMRASRLAILEHLDEPDLVVEPVPVTAQPARLAGDP